MMSHINSYTRKKLNNQSAHRLFNFLYGDTFCPLSAAGNLRKRYQSDTPPDIPCPISRSTTANPHGAPVREIQNTPLINRRLSCAIPPHCPRCPGRCGSRRFHTSLLISCRCCSLLIGTPLSGSCPYYTILLVQTLFSEFAAMRIFRSFSVFPPF